MRDYNKGPLNQEQVSQLLWAASGKNLYRRTAPSAGATYPLEIHLVIGEVDGLEKGISYYSPSRHTLERKKEQDIRNPLSKPGRLF